MTRNGINWKRLRELDEANPREHTGEHVCVDGRRYVSDCWVLAWHSGEHRLRDEYEARKRTVKFTGDVRDFAQILRAERGC